MAFNNQMIDLIDQRIAAAWARSDARDTKVGTCIERTSNTTAMVIFDGSSLAVPVKLLGDVDARAEDRVILARAGSEWVIIGSFTFREGPKYIAYGERGSSSNTTTTEVRVLRIDNIPLTNGKWYEIVTPAMIVDSSVNTDDAGIRVRARFDGAVATLSSTIVGGTLQKQTASVGQTVSTSIRMYHCEADGEVLSALLSVFRAAGSGNVSIVQTSGFPVQIFVREAGIMPPDTGVVVN